MDGSKLKRASNEHDSPLRLQPEKLYSMHTWGLQQRDCGRDEEEYVQTTLLAQVMWNLC